MNQKNPVLRILLPLLVIALAFALTACGQGNQEKENPAETSEKDTVYGYKSEFVSIDSPAAGAVSPALFTEDGFYAVGTEVVGKREIPEGKYEEYEGQYDIYASQLYYVTKDGKAEKLPKFEPILPMEDTGEYQSFFSYASLNRPTWTPDGKLTAVLEQYIQYFDGPESALGTETEWQYYHFDNLYDIVVLDTDGTLLSRAPIDVDMTDSYLNAYNAVCDKDGNLMVFFDQSVLAVAPDGSIAYTITGDNYLNNLVRNADGTALVLMYGNNGAELHPVDIENKKFGEAIALPGDIWTLIPGDENYDFYYSSGMYLYGFRLGETEPVQILDWMSVDINGDTVDTNVMRIQPDGTIIGITYDYDRDTTETQIFTLTRVPEDSLPKKEILTIAQLQYADYTMNNRIVRFNRTHENVRIVLQDYSQYNTENDASAGITRFTAELMAGNGTDIIPLSSLPYRQLAAKGLLEDLYPYIDQDPELDRGDFFPNVLETIEVNGGLYQAVSSFSVQTLTGAASVVGDTPGWTYDDFHQALAKMPKGCTPLDVWYTKDDVLSALLSANMDRFVDWSTGKVDFENEEFKQLLAFANEFPASFDWETYDYSESTADLIKQGRQMLCQSYLYSLDSLMWNDSNFGGKATYIGWPTTEGVGSIMNLDTGYAINKNCSNKEAVWEFLRSLLTEEGQSTTVWMIPTNRKAFDKRLEELMKTEYRKDSSGNYILDENGEKIPQVRGSYLNDNGEEINIYAMTREQADEALAIIETCTRAANYDTSITEIVKEQVQAYFEGQKSLDEVCRLIQSKANLYVNEQR